MCEFWCFEQEFRFICFAQINANYSTNHNFRKSIKDSNYDSSRTNDKWIIKLCQDSTSIATSTVLKIRRSKRRIIYYFIEVHIKSASKIIFISARYSWYCFRSTNVLSLSLLMSLQFQMFLCIYFIFLCFTRLTLSVN